MKKFKIILISLFALCLFATNISATQDYEPGFEYDYVLYDTEKFCEFCGCNDWYLIIDKEFNLDIIVCQSCGFWYYWEY